ncbi:MULTISPECIES: FAD-dependent oxidoreductase [unclassified Pseudodesulfovibrio]|uniref:NAD(P)/FAD-dependent oxidoreductase n=1 Tax=unclassified Pseudodesulfovibrio TaxID=2661612 RepID=UPI000FEB7DD4|nr:MULTISPECIES: FAD-dependent oxidoreductase [unclassified Pseudodesulfovibrio]MCJ2163869.1 FAD-dependent oxidoreductase [Pseudodesulfovibrio sp. S3-i]RWU05885.1 NAD(P)/FAD-dependent oxidoreductase [Pseudodesulfovibrio sp. S3]
MKYVIIGNGIASIGAIEGIRKVDTENEILIIGAEDSPAYGRPLISYLLAGKIGPDRLALRPQEFFEKSNVSLMLGTKVTGIDAKAKTVSTDKGETVAFEHLLIATGGIPFTPPIPGADGSDVYNFTNLAHAQTLISKAKDIKRAVVIGGGLIGLKAGESLFDRGVDVTILELSPRILSLAFDENAASLAGGRLAEVGLNVRCGVSAKEIQRDAEGNLKGVHLTDGDFLQCDVVVIAIGVVPNYNLAKESGIEVDRGIKVDEHMHTSADSVFAAGDVAQAKDLLFGEDRVIPIWTNAYNQGFCAGKNMAGADIRYTGSLSMNSISFYGLPTISVGTVNPPEGDDSFEIAAALDEKKKSYRKLVFQNDRLVGYVLVGDIDMAGMYTAFVKFQMAVPEDAKKQIMAGEPDVLMWPDDFFKETWNPGVVEPD